MKGLRLQRWSFTSLLPGKQCLCAQQHSVEHTVTISLCRHRHIQHCSSMAGWAREARVGEGFKGACMEN